MLLTIDANNLTTRFALFEGDRLVHVWQASTRADRSADEWALRLRGFLAAEGVAPSVVDQAILASVVPPLTATLVELVRTLFSQKPLLLTGESDLGMTLDYPNPDELGADRLAGAVGARARFGAPVIVVSFGLATHFDVVNERGAFVGGAIAPGLEAAMNALASGAARLFNVELRFPPAVIGRSTVEAIQSGLMFGYVSMVEGMVGRLRHELGRSCPVVATGPHAPLLATHTPLFDAVAPHLVLHGLRLIHTHQTP